jgi:hypothetical protein
MPFFSDSRTPRLLTRVSGHRQLQGYEIMFYQSRFFLPGRKTKGILLQHDEPALSDGPAVGQRTPVPERCQSHATLALR